MVRPNTNNGRRESQLGRLVRRTVEMIAVHETQLEANAAEPLSSQVDIPESVHVSELSSTASGFHSATGFVETVGDFKLLIKGISRNLVRR